MNYLENIPIKDYGDVTALEFEDFFSKKLSLYGNVSRQVKVNDRGDGRTGRVDILLTELSGRRVGFEIDRVKPRKKSLFKLNNMGVDEAFIVTRSPLSIKKVI